MNWGSDGSLSLSLPILALPRLFLEQELEPRILGRRQRCSEIINGSLKVLSKW